MSKEADDSINEAINELYSEVDDSILQESKENLNNKPTKLIECSHEIVFKIVANVLEENTDGTVVGAKEIYAQNYHIPVPSGNDYKVFVDTFFGFLEQSLSTAAEKTYDSEENNEQKKPRKRTKRKSK
jgi:hypothetical protein